jgi:hypothetical protein
MKQPNWMTGLEGQWISQFRPRGSAPRTLAGWAAPGPRGKGSERPGPGLGGANQVRWSGSTWPNP